jgi:hypothetical protein
VCHDYQEIKVQESTQVLGVGAIPRSILVILKDDLVDVVKAGGIFPSNFHLTPQCYLTCPHHTGMKLLVHHRYLCFIFECMCV